IISFSLSMTSNDRSGRTVTTIMWIEFVPMSIAAIRMLGGRERKGWLRTCLLHRRYILPVRSFRAASYHEPFAPPGPPARAPKPRPPPAPVSRGRGKGYGRASGARRVTPPPRSVASLDRRAAPYEGQEGGAQGPAGDPGPGH